MTARNRSQKAHALLEQAGAEAVELPTLSALELCALGGAGQHQLFDELVARTWLSAPAQLRSRSTKLAIEGLADRGLLVAHEPPNPPAGFDAVPTLAAVLAAKTRPTVAVLAQLEPPLVRPVKLYGLGDEGQPLRAILLELPRRPSPDAPPAPGLGVLARLYRHVLMPVSLAVDVVVDWAEAADLHPPGSAAARCISVWRHENGELKGQRLVLPEGLERERLNALLHESIVGAGATR